MKVNLRKIIREEVDKFTNQRLASTPSKNSNVKYGTFNLNALKNIIQVDNETYLTQALMKIQQNKSESLTLQEKDEVVSFFTKMLQLDDSDKVKVFNIIRQSVKVTKQ